jgi:tetratricopeptide (TPR) repeat protein
MRSLLVLSALIVLSLPAAADEVPEFLGDDAMELMDEAPPLPDNPAEPPAQAAAPAGEPAEKKLKPAEMRAEQLDILFAHLRRPGVRSEPVELKIWALWAASDSPTAEVLLQQAARAIDDRAPAEALSILDRLVGAYPAFAEAWNKRATLYFMMKRYDQSLTDIEKVLELEPRHFGALAGKGVILERQRKFSAARAAYEEALAVNPTLEQVKDALKELDRMEQGI